MISLLQGSIRDLAQKKTGNISRSTLFQTRQFSLLGVDKSNIYMDILATSNTSMDHDSVIQCSIVDRI